MMAANLEQEVRARHAAGASPKEIARALGVRPSEVAPIVRRLAGERTAAAGPGVPALLGCWVSPGWSAGLTIEGGRDWPEAHEDSGRGLVCLAIARRHRHDKVALCTYLVDTYCLGVKDALGPRTMTEQDLVLFLARFFRAFENPSLQAPIELAQHLVLGAIEYARGLGFDPHPDYDRARAYLGIDSLAEPCAIQYGRNGKPLYVQGPHDDPDRIISTLEKSVGRDNFDFVVGQAAMTWTG